MSFFKNNLIAMIAVFGLLNFAVSARAAETADVEQAKAETGAALQAVNRDFTPPEAVEKAEEKIPEVEIEEPALEDEDAMLDADTEYSYGTVASVDAAAIQVKEYDYDSGADVSVDYVVDPAAKFEGANSLKDVAVGDNIEIDYLEKDGKRVILSMSVEKPFTEEEKSEALANEADQAG